MSGNCGLRLHRRLGFHVEEAADVQVLAVSTVLAAALTVEAAQLRRMDDNWFPRGELFHLACQCISLRELVRCDGETHLFVLQHNGMLMEEPHTIVVGSRGWVSVSGATSTGWRTGGVWDSGQLHSRLLADATDVGTVCVDLVTACALIAAPLLKQNTKKSITCLFRAVQCVDAACGLHYNGYGNCEAPSSTVDGVNYDEHAALHGRRLRRGSGCRRKTTHTNSA